MNMKVSYLDNSINFDENINVIEIENKKYFYRFINDLYSISDVGFSDDIDFFENEQEKNMNGKIKILINFFDFQFDSKKYSTDIAKYVNEYIGEEEKNNLNNLYKKIIISYNKILNNIDLPLSIDDDINLESLTKLVKVSINSKEDLLDNLMLLIDLENVLKTKNILFFVNLKQYLNKVELVELYKYSIYSDVKICLVDSQSYGGTLEYEKKFIIDENLDEFVI